MIGQCMSIKLTTPNSVKDNTYTVLKVQNLMVHIVNLHRGHRVKSLGTIFTTKFIYSALKKKFFFLLVNVLFW